MIYTLGEQVLVIFDGESHSGRVVHVGKGYIFAKIVIDPLSDYGPITAHMGLESVVYARDKDVRRPDEVD